MAAQKKQNKQNKTQDILKYLQTHKRGISSMEAFEKFKETRLSAVIFNLRKYGHNIVAQKIDGTTAVRYVLVEE